MPVYSFKAIDHTGKVQAGTLTADSPVEARQQLRDRGLRIQTFDVFTAKASCPILASLVNRVHRTRIREQVCDFARHLALLLHAGIPLTESLDVLIQQADTSSWRGILQDIKDRIRGGSALDETLDEYPQLFPPLLRSAVRVGRQSGAMAQSLDHAGEYLKRQNSTHNQVVGALLYPSILLILGVGVIVFLMTWVIPQLLTVLTAAGKPLPWPTMLLKTLSDSLIVYWWVWLLVLVLSSGSILGIYRSPNGQRWTHRLLLRIPVLGSLIQKSTISTVARELELLLDSGVPFVEAVRIVHQGTSHPLLTDDLQKVESAVTAGHGIADALRDSRMFPPMMVYMMAVGQETGELPTMLGELNRGYITEVSLAVERFTTIIEPVLIVLLAGGIGFVLFATMLPILETTRILT